MPTLDSDLIRAPIKTTISVALEPVQNMIHSLMLLYQAENLSGLNEWITQTVSALSPDRLHTNRLVLEGLHYAVKPTRSWPSFPAYIDHLAATDPYALRDQIIAAYDGLCHSKDSSRKPSDPEMVLATLDTFLDYLREGFPPEKIDVQIETEAFALLKNPPAMKALIVSHLHTMWTDVLATEWERNVPLLQTCVDAFQQINYDNLTTLQVAQEIMGQELPEKWKSLLEREIEQIIFVPSAHLGPYRGVFMTDRALWLLFGARLPEGTQISSPDLSRAELLVRLNALADDTRLSILQTLKDKRMCSKDIMQQLDLSQSAASRHLKQLSATGYLNERRQNGAKCYRLNEDRVENTLLALSHFLLGDKS